MDAVFTTIAYSSPVLLTLAAIEIYWLRRHGRPYHARDSLLSLADLAIRRVVTAVIGGGVLITVARWIPYRWMDLPLRTESGWNWLNISILVLAVEFFYYWFHRWSHEIRWFWATHAVHHSSNSMSLLTAERLGWTQTLSGAALTFFPLVLLGFKAQDVSIVLSLNLLYQFWLHTEVIGKLGWFESVFNTPSHHRVHHGANPRYLDANYGGILIIWDRLFGTFVAESSAEPVRFGLVKPVVSNNPIYIALHEWMNLAKDVSQHWRSPKRLLGYLAGPPGWSHDGSRLTSAQMKRGVADKR